jgi:hypothetical protein
MKNDAAAGSHLIVRDINAASRNSAMQVVVCSDLFHFVEGAQADGPAANRAGYETFLSFSDPDGSTRHVQEVPSRASRAAPPARSASASH